LALTPPEEAALTAIRGVLGPDYEIRAADLRRAAKRAVEAFCGAIYPPLQAGRDYVRAGAAFRPRETPTVAQEAAGAWAVMRALELRAWVDERMAETPDEWTLCLHRRGRIDNDWPHAGSRGDMVNQHVELSAHMLPPGFVCDFLPHEQYVKPKFVPVVEPD
jgi:hypothetical protein